MYHIGCNHLCPNGIDPNDEGTNTRQTALRFERAQLLYDIRNCAYIEGEVMGEERQHAQHTLVDVGEEGNVDRVSRILGTAFSSAVEMLYPYTKESALEDGEEVDDRQWEPDEYVMRLSVPTEFSRTTLHLLSKLIHDYLVAKVLYEWLGITNPDAAAKWLAKADAAEEEINDIKNLRTGVLLRPSRPF